MKIAIGVVVLSAALGAATVQAQTTQPQSTQQRPDARYPNPSGQDSSPKQTKVAPTKTAQPSANPEDPTTSTKGKAADQTYQVGKKADASAGCSTPTDAQSAGVDASRAQGQPRQDGKKTVCTTAGAEGVGATDKKNADNKKSAEAQTTKPAPKAR